MHVVALVLAGGSGERFWPVSTADRPKQFLRLTSSGKTLLEEGIERASLVAERGQVYLSTSEMVSKLIALELQQFPSANIVVEPHKRNTAGALVWAVASIRARLGEEFLMAVLTADHLIEPVEEFAGLATRALALADAKNGLVTMGIRPTMPETGYGYIEIGQHLPEGGWQVKEFKEKPDLRSAERYLDDGLHLWNSGMFFWRTDVFERELAIASASLAESLAAIEAHLREGREAEAAALLERLPSISIDRALMEKSSNRFVVEATFRWDDLGTWDSVRRSTGADAQGNTVHGNVRLDRAMNVLAYNASGLSVHAFGVEDLIVVVTDEQVFVCHKDLVQDIRDFSAEG